MKMFKKSLSITLVAMMLISAFALCSFAADTTVSLRIEGIDKCLFYGEVTAKADATVLDVIKAADGAVEEVAEEVAEEATEEAAE